MNFSISRVSQVGKERETNQSFLKRLFIILNQVNSLEASLSGGMSSNPNKGKQCLCGHVPPPPPPLLARVNCFLICLLGEQSLKGLLCIKSSHPSHHLSSAGQWGKRIVWFQKSSIKAAFLFHYSLPALF